MKKLLVLTALAALIATGAMATVNSPANLKKIQRYAPDADVSDLTNREISVLLHVINSSDNEGEKRSFVRSFFRKRG
ncbi:MAG: hypothetical protein ACR2O1_00450 [Boseongicola sp.]